jgi:hypothetical protein
MNYQQLAEKRKSKEVGDAVYNIYCRYLNFKDYYQDQVARCTDNWNMYLPIDTAHGYGQYPADVIATLIAQKRAPLTFNLAKPTADLIASGLVQAPFDPVFYPVDKPITWLTKAVEKAMFSDKEICDWGQAYFELVRAGCVMQGDITMRIIDDFHRLGNIALNNCLPNSIMYSPSWKTARTRDCPRCFHEQYLMPDQAMEFYGDSGDDIQKGIESFRNKNEEYGARTGAVPFSGQDGLWGSAIQFVHEYSVQVKKVKKIFIVTQEGDMAIPDNIIGDSGKVMDWLDKTFGYEKWDSENIFEDVVKERVCIKDTIAPALLGTNVIESGEPEIQIGQIPFWTWSCDRVNGEPHGIIDQIKDAQRTINYWNSLIQYKIQTEGGGGKYIDKSKFESPQEAQRAIENHNDPAEIFALKPGVLDQGGKPIAPINAGTGVPAEVYAHLDRIINQIWPMISKTTPTGRGMQEGSNESGYLYNLKKIQSDHMVYTIHYTLRQYWNQVYEGYLLQAAKTYSNEGIPRVFSFNKGKSKIVLNERVNFPDGSIGIRNDMSKLNEIRHKIIISDQQQSPTQNLTDLQAMSEYLKSIVPMVNLMPASISYTLGAITKKIDQFDEDDKDSLEEIQGLELESMLGDLELKSINTQIQVVQAKSKLEQTIDAINNPPPPQPLQQITEQPALPGEPAAPAVQSLAGEAVQPPIQNPVQATPELQGAPV